MNVLASSRLRCTKTRSTDYCPQVAGVLKPNSYSAGRPVGFPQGAPSTIQLTSSALVVSPKRTRAFEAEISLSIFYHGLHLSVLAPDETAPNGVHGGPRSFGLAAVHCAPVARRLPLAPLDGARTTQRRTAAGLCEHHAGCEMSAVRRSVCTLFRDG